MRLPANAVYDVAPVDQAGRILLLMLPGAKHAPQHLVENGFIRALRERKLAVDVLVLDAHADLYLDGEQIECMLHDALNEARSHGYSRIWVLGISLGGTGAILCTVQRTAEIEGVFLLAPFLGTRGIIAEVSAAGGLAHWQAGEISSRDRERALLAELKSSLLDMAGFPPIYLGYGSADRYRGASDLLARHLPSHQVEVMPGGHDWETWAGLWRMLLDKRPFPNAEA
ncbi:hypothetical protein MIZ01_2396 [Sideroxyarcus emersonii]|uniref:Alpha/beta hydrolase n=1 Tax=Sideroxyarcus emersonii TaxID=2764705 RepID=A0AAN1XC77_9PROT|nr:hypothetical protein [Sideroxyarcus emersonii]BCK88591.1 hypothetical protein MIZ01_2396 [Sideroxyarcus emersonii]